MAAVTAAATRARAVGPATGRGMRRSFLERIVSSHRLPTVRTLPVRERPLPIFHAAPFPGLTGTRESHHRLLVPKGPRGPTLPVVRLARAVRGRRKLRLRQTDRHARAEPRAHGPADACAPQPTEPREIHVPDELDRLRPRWPRRTTSSTRLIPVDPDVSTATWTATTHSEEIIDFDAGESGEPVNHNANSPAIGSAPHVFAIVAVDNQGLHSPTVNRAFFSTTVAPSW